VEAVLESQDETERIFSDLNAEPQVMEWRDTLQMVCKEIIDDLQTDIRFSNNVILLMRDGLLRKRTISNSIAAFLVNPEEGR
jgi:hypothetical protein